MITLKKEDDFEKKLSLSANIDLVKYVYGKKIFLPMTLSRMTMFGDNYRWTSSKGLFPPNTSEHDRIKLTLGNLHVFGLDEPIMMDQPNPDENENTVHEITYEEVVEWMNDDHFLMDGTLWNVPKNYSAIFIRKEVRDKVLRDFGIDLSLVYPAADCAVVRFYDEKTEVMGIAHVDAKFAGKNLIKDCVDFAKNKFGIYPKDMFAFVNAFATSGYVYTVNPPKWAVVIGTNGKPIEGMNGFPVVKGEWNKYIRMHKEDGVLITDIDYGRKIFDQLEECGITKEHTSSTHTSTVGDQVYFSNIDFNREKAELSKRKRTEIEAKLGEKAKDINLEAIVKKIVEKEQYKLKNCGRNLAIAAFPLDNNNQPTKLYRRAGMFHSHIE